MKLTEQKFEQILDAKLKPLNDRVGKIEANMATKDDLKGFATKDDLKGFATKDDLKGFATKDDLLSLEQRMGQKFATKDDLRYGLNSLETKLKDFAKEQTSELGAMIAETVAIPLKEHIEKCEGVRV